MAGIQDIDDDDWDFIFGVNTKGLLNSMRAQIPFFNSGGAIVNAASVAGIIGFKNNGSYVASKHAVVGLTKTAAKELGPKNIRVNCFCPYVSIVDISACRLAKIITEVPSTPQCSGSQQESVAQKWISALSL
jgi:NAD(P)-dependent dehydrogenase (short-subunit alcohol dehydrogenase family)